MDLTLLIHSFLKILSSKKFIIKFMSPRLARHIYCIWNEPARLCEIPPWAWCKDLSEGCAPSRPGWKCFCQFHQRTVHWFVKIYQRNLKKLRFTTQRFDTPVTPVGSWIATSLGYVHKFLQTRVAYYVWSSPGCRELVSYRYSTLFCKI